MDRFLVGFRCKDWKFGCDCNVDTPEEVKQDFAKNYGIDYEIDYEDYCYYDVIMAETPDFDFEYALKQQGAVEYESAKEIFVSFEILVQFHDNSVKVGDIKEVYGGYGYDIPFGTSIVTRLYTTEELPSFIDVDSWRFDEEDEIYNSWIEFIVYDSFDSNFDTQIAVVPFDVYLELVRLAEKERAESK